MVYFEKSQPAPTIGNTHNSQEILDRLEIDFKNKCYICEEKELQNLNIEHFISHQGNSDLRLDWNNLFLSCRHCNDIKSTKYDNLLNCTMLSDSVDIAIHYYCTPMPKEKPIFRVLIPSDKAESTKELLDKCFNGEHTAQKALEGSSLRSSLLKEIRVFQNLLFDYYENKDNEYFLIKIKEHLSNRSAFTAFKRWIIRDNPTLTQQFQKYI